MSVKVTMIGGGSSSFVPPLLRNFIESEELRDTRLTLMDVSADRLETMVKLAEKLIEAESSPLEVTGMLDQREALTGANFVIAAISVGGMDAWANDIEIPGRYGIFMNVADSIGPGGIFRTLRNAPVQESVARDVSEVAPGAQIFNYEPRRRAGPCDAHRARHAGHLAVLGHPAAVQRRVARRAGGC